MEPAATLDDLPPVVAARVRGELGDGERLIWIGRPRIDLWTRLPGCIRPGAILAVALGLLLPLLGLGLGLVLGRGHVDSALFLGTIGLGLGAPFLAVGTGLLVLPAWGRARARMIWYAVTDRRAIAWEPTPFGGIAVTSFTRDDLEQMACRENPDGSGSLIFDEYPDVRSGSGTYASQGFSQIDRVRFVEALIRRVLLEGPG